MNNRLPNIFLAILLFCIEVSAFQDINFQDTNNAKYDTIAKKYQEAYYNGDLQLYRQYIDEAILFSKKHQLKDRHILALMNKGIYQKNVGELDSTITTYSSILKLIRSHPDTSKTKIMVRMNLANAYMNIEEKDKAVVLLNKVLKNAALHPDGDHILNAANSSLGIIYLEDERFDEAEEHFLKAKEFAIKNDNPQPLININNSLSDVYYKSKRYKEALVIAEDAIRDNPKDSSRTKASSYYSKGAALFHLDRTEEAIHYLTIADGIASSKKFYELAMLTSQMLAKAYESEEEYQKSLEAQKQYVKKKEKYLSSLSEAKRIEMERELKEQEEINILRQEELSVYKSRFFKTSIIIISLLVLLLVFYVYYRKRKKLLILNQYILQRDKEILKSEKEELQSKLKNLSTSVINNPKNDTPFKYKKSSISEEDRTFYVTQVLEYMDKEKPYLDYEIKQSDIADQLGITLHQFSEILNTSLENNFNNFINLYRVNEAKEMIKNPQYKDYKIIAIGYEAGFKSKTSFNRAFKNLVGLTPSEYKKQSA